MRRERSRVEGRVEVEYTTKPVSGWGGLVLLGRFFEQLGVRERLAQALPDGRTSNNRIPVVDLVVQFLATIIVGGRRFEHVERVREDQVVSAALGVNRMGSASSLIRYLSNFLPSHVEHMHKVTRGLIGEYLAASVGSDIIDLDSTVLMRYGHQQGSSKGYNPHRPGGLSHHPLLGMLAKSKVILHAWLRAGAASPLRGCQEFLTELLAGLPEKFRIEALRADSGFYSEGLFQLLEHRKIPYVIAARMTRPLTKWCQERTGWTEITRDLAVTSAEYRSSKWDRSRRMIVLRKAIRRENDGVLFEVVDYEHHAFITSMVDSPEQVWRFYLQRGDCENRIKELKHDFNAGGFCLQSFHGTEAAFRLVVFAFNLIAIFKKMILKDSKTTLSTIRTKVFVIGASLGRSARKFILRLGLTGRWRIEFDKLLNEIENLSTSTAAQLNRSTHILDCASPSRWRLRRVRVLKFDLY